MYTYSGALASVLKSSVAREANLDRENRDFEGIAVNSLARREGWDDNVVCASKRNLS